MPHLSRDMIAEIELEITDLIEENEKLRKDNAALLAELQRLRATLQVP